MFAGVGRVGLWASAYGGTSFTPLSLFAAGEPGVWYDPSDLSTMFQDSAGTTPVTAVDQPVGKILDKSGRGNHATQGTSTKRPVLKQGVGGLYYLYFDGVDDYLECTSMNRSSWTDGVAFTGQLSVALTGAALGGLDGSADSNHEPFSDNNWYVSFGTNTRVNPTTLAYNTAYVLTRIRNSGTSSYRKNGTVSATTAAGTTSFGGTGTITVGAESTTSYNFKGNVYSLIVRGVSTSASLINSTESWVNGKTGAY